MVEQDNDNKETKPNSWDSELVICRPEIILQSGVQDIIVSTQRLLTNYEFSILFKGFWHDKGIFFVTNEYFIPEQIVENMAIEYIDSIAIKRSEGFNVVAHSHPFANDTYFSADDEEHINSHFPCSLLSNNKGRVIRGNLLVTINEFPDGKLSIPIESENIDINIPSVMVEGIEKIKKKPKKKRKPVDKTEMLCT